MTVNVTRPARAVRFCGAMRKSSSVMTASPPRTLARRLAAAAAARGRRPRPATAMARARGIGGRIVPYAVAPSMAPSLRRPLVAVVLAAFALSLAACGEEGIQLSQDDPNYEGAALFDENCAGCHTLTVGRGGGLGHQGRLARAQGRPELRRAQGGPRERPLRDPQRRLLVLPMPQNIVTGEEAEKVADFVAKYSGSAAASSPGSSGRVEPRCSTSSRSAAIPTAVRAALARRRDGSDARLDRVLELDERTRALRPEVETLRARQNEASKAIGAAKQAGGDAAEEIAAMQEVAQRVKALGQELSERRRRAAGRAGHAARTRRTRPRPTTTPCCARSASAAGPARTTSTVAGGADRRGGGRARGRLALRLPEGRPRAARARARALGDVGARRATASARRPAGAGARGGAVRDRLPARHRAADLPAARRRPVTWSARARSPLASLHAGEILDEGVLPLRYAGFSPCFRREAGAAGRDTRGIFRVHQFDKVEMFCFVEPEASADEHERLLAIEEELLQALEHPVPRRQHRRRRPRLVGGQEVRPRGVDARPASATAR